MSGFSQQPRRSSDNVPSMRNRLQTTAAFILSALTLASVLTPGAVQASTGPSVLPNSGLYVSGADQKPVLRLTLDESGRSIQIEGPRVRQTTLSVNENHNFDTTTALESGVVSKDFVRKCTAKPGQEKPCFKGLYDTTSGKLRLQAGDEYNVTARLLILSSDSVLQMQWITWTRDDSMIAQKFTKQVLTLAPRAKNSGTLNDSSDTTAGSKDPISL